MTGKIDKRPQMKRFYKTVSVDLLDEGGYMIQLDGRPIKTPLKQTLGVHSFSLAKAIAKEWDDQKDEIDLEGMLFTKLSHTTLDRVRAMNQDVLDEILSFAGSDLLCYRATEPNSLVVREQERWDPFLSWFESTYNIKMKTVCGIVHEEQNLEDLRKIADLLGTLDDFSLTAVHNITSLTGSALLALALVLGDWTSHEIWAAAFIDEDYQMERWGGDEEVIRRREMRRAEFDKTYEFYQLSQVKS